MFIRVLERGGHCRVNCRVPEDVPIKKEVNLTCKYHVHYLKHRYSPEGVIYREHLIEKRLIYHQLPLELIHNSSPTLLLTDPQVCTFMTHFFTYSFNFKNKYDVNIAGKNGETLFIFGKNIAILVSTSLELILNIAKLLLFSWCAVNYTKCCCILTFHQN